MTSTLVMVYPSAENSSETVIGFDLTITFPNRYVLFHFAYGHLDYGQRESHILLDTFHLLGLCDFTGLQDVSFFRFGVVIFRVRWPLINIYSLSV